MANVKKFNIRESIEKASSAFHSHLNVCSQCRNRPFNLCREGSELIFNFQVLKNIEERIYEKAEKEKAWSEILSGKDAKEEEKDKTEKT